MPKDVTSEWLDDPDREEVRLVWPVAGGAGAKRYPLTVKPEGDAPYAFEIHRAGEYVVPITKSIAPLPTVCNCKEDISFEWDPEEVVPAFPRATGFFS